MKTLGFTAALLIAFTFNSVANDRNTKDVAKERTVVFPMVDVLPGDVNTKDVETLKYHAFLSGPAVEFGTPLDVLNSKSVEALKNNTTYVRFPEMEWGAPEDVEFVFAGAVKKHVVFPEIAYGTASDVNTAEINALIKQ